MNQEELSAQRAEKWREELRRSRKAKERTDIPRVKMKELDPASVSYTHLRAHET